ncbi:creatininase family protein [Dactylosporangium sp. NPDC000555]|uniref:creatininase family protein n=1 Tax=Dactylosporangium sp. NPDC000555 TaxID=3154260 RepID=UPI0033231161
MALLHWADCDRETLRQHLPSALVVLPVGAVEQHGPHLPTGTDAFIVEATVEAAVRQAAPSAPRDLVLVPTLRFGASDHHFPFGATLSLTVETLTQVLIDLARSVAAAGGRRLLIVNGHGGNRGACHAASAAAASRYGLSVGHLDYWQLLTGPDDADRVDEDPRSGTPIPGHAGAFETSMIAHLRPAPVGNVPHRPSPPQVPEVPDVMLHDDEIWRHLDGYTDDPSGASAEAGAQWFARCVARLSERIIAVAATEVAVVKN